jgi:hypothetical protein
MKRLGHQITFLTGVIILLILFWQTLQWWYLPILLESFILFDPDWMEIYLHIQEKHRHWITHSIIPIFIWNIPFWFLMDINSFHIYIGLNFLPVILHLIADLGGVKGYGLINCYPFKNRETKSRKMNVPNSYLWLISNIGFGIYLMIRWI